jgi:hypothetical protein
MADETTIKDQLLTEQVEGNAPAVTPVEEKRGWSTATLSTTVIGGEVQADPKKEYVAGGWRGPLGGYLQALEPWIDPLTRDFGPDLYERMAWDPHLSGETLVFKTAVLGQGVRLTPAVNGDAVGEDGDGYRTAKRVRDFCQSILNNLDTPLMPLLREMLDAHHMGFKVAEVVYQEDGRWLMPYKIKPKRRDAIAFVVDSRMNVQGLLAALAGRETYAMSLTQLVDPSTTHNILPRAKFAVLSWDSLSDPRGKSAYRPCYDPWWLKQQTLAEMMKYIAQAAGERIVGYTAEGARAVQAYNADGTAQVDGNGLPVYIHPETAMLSALQQIRSGSVAAFPFGSQVESLASSTEGQAFFQSLDYFDRQMSKALLGQTLASNEGQHQARASSETGKDVMDLVTEYGETLLADMLRRDVLRVAVEINLGKPALKYLPLVSLSAAEEADIAKIGSVASMLFTAGYFSENQLSAMDSKLGLPAAEGDRGAYLKQEPEPENIQKPEDTQKPPVGNQTTEDED